MPTFPPEPVDIDRLLRVAQGRRRTMRARCPGDRFRAAMAILKQEKERMRGEWSLDAVYEWPDDGDDTPCAPPRPAPSASLPPVPRFVNPHFASRSVGPAPVPEAQFHRTVLHVPDAVDDGEGRTPPRRGPQLGSQESPGKLERSDEPHPTSPRRGEAGTATPFRVRGARRKKDPLTRLVRGTRRPPQRGEVGRHRLSA